MSPWCARAVVAAEDQLFAEHAGFDFDAIRKAAEHNARSKRVRGASTISQQVAKNLFLWRGRSWVRKGFEVWFTVLIETLWPKERILEVYLNIAEFGRGVYGVEAAAQVFWGKRAQRLSRVEAATSPPCCRARAAIAPRPVTLRAAPSRLDPAPDVGARDARRYGRRCRVLAKRAGHLRPRRRHCPDVRTRCMNHQRWPSGSTAR